MRGTGCRLRSAGMRRGDASRLERTAEAAAPPPKTQLASSLRSPLGCVPVRRRRTRAMVSLLKLEPFARPTGGQPTWIGIEESRAIPHSRGSTCNRHQPGHTVAPKVVNPLNVTSVLHGRDPLGTDADLLDLRLFLRRYRFQSLHLTRRVCIVAAVTLRLSPR